MRASGQHPNSTPPDISITHTTTSPLTGADNESTMTNPSDTTPNPDDLDTIREVDEELFEPAPLGPFKPKRLKSRRASGSQVISSPEALASQPSATSPVPNCPPMASTRGGQTDFFNHDPVTVTATHPSTATATHYRQHLSHETATTPIQTLKAHRHLYTWTPTVKMTSRRLRTPSRQASSLTATPTRAQRTPTACDPIRS